MESNGLWCVVLERKVIWGFIPHSPLSRERMENNGNDLSFWDFLSWLNRGTAGQIQGILYVGKAEWGGPTDLG